MAYNTITSRIDPNIDTYSIPDSAFQYGTDRGKFEGNSRFIPLMWDSVDYNDQIMFNDAATSELWESIDAENDHSLIDYEGLPYVYCYTVTLSDVLMFPELETISKVYLYEDSQGFVNVYQITESDTPIWHCGALGL